MGSRRLRDRPEPLTADAPHGGHMRRRSIVVGAGTILGSALAGCLGSGQETLDERPAGNEVEDALRTAIGEANTVALELASAREEAATVADLSIDAATLRDGLDAATGALDAAEEYEAAGDYETERSEARAYVGAVEGLLEGSTTLIDVAGQLDGLETTLQSQDFDAAAGELDAIRPAADDARSTTTDARSSASEIDAAVLDPYGAKMDELTDGLDTVANISIGVDELTVGYGALLAGRDDLAAGRDALDGGNDAAAASSFQSAASEFTTATDHFETARAETDGELSGRIDVALCRSGALTDAAGHFEAAADAAGSGDRSGALRQQERGEAALQTADSCGQ